LDQGQGAAQKAQLDEQLATGLASANISDIRLAQAKIVPGDNGKVLVDAGGLVVKYRDKQVAAANPQGFSGGGFAVGGAMLSLEGHRAESNAAAESSAADAPPTEKGTTSPDPATSAPATMAGGAVALSGTSAATADLAEQPAGGASDSLAVPTLSAQKRRSSAPSLATEVAQSDPTSASGFTAAVTPEPPNTGRHPRPQLLLAQPAAASVTHVRESDWVGAIYLGLIAVPLLVLVGFRLARSR